MYGGGDLDNVEDIRFSLSGGGEDLRVIIPGGDRVTIQDMNDPAKQVEILTLFEGNKEVGWVSLVDKYGELVLEKAPPPEPKPEQSEPETVQDLGKPGPGPRPEPPTPETVQGLGGDRPSEKQAAAPKPEPGPRPEPPAPETVQDLGGDKPSGQDSSEDEKIDFAGLPPPPPPLPPGPPPSLLGSAPEPDAEPEPPVSDTVQDLGGNEPTGSNDEIFIA